MKTKSTSFDVVDGSVFPAEQFLITVNDEIMLVGSRSGNTFSNISRAQEGTVASAHERESAIENKFTAGTYEDLIIYIDEGNDPDYIGIKYKLAMINGEPFMKVIET